MAEGRVMSRPLPTTDAEAIARLRAAVQHLGADHAIADYERRRTGFESRVGQCFAVVLFNATGRMDEPKPEPEQPSTEGQVCLLATSLHRLLLAVRENEVIPVEIDAMKAIDARRKFAVSQAEEALRACGWTLPGDVTTEGEPAS
jgi:hypothetical protein